jgi:hypothetical protein
MFDPVRICTILNEERVEYVVVGGFAAVVTDFGEMYHTFVPAGRAGGYDGWRIGATQEELSDGLVVVVAGLDDIIDSKRAANRPKDQMALPYLESLRDESATAEGFQESALPSSARRAATRSRSSVASTFQSSGTANVVLFTR